MQDFPANSAKARARAEGPPQSGRPEKIERVVSGEAVRRKRGLGRQFKDTFINGDAKSALDYVVSDVVVPSIRDLIFESFQSGLEKLVYGESRIRRGAPPSVYSSNPPRVNYQAMSSPTTTRALSQRARTRHDFGEIVLQSRQDAEDVLDSMYDILSRHDSVLVADLYALTDIQSSHVDQKWGWTSLRGAKIARMRSGGYLLDLPQPESLDR